jgi:GxxExxY protein
MTQTDTLKLIYPELSYKVVGVLFEAYNTLGSGHKESVYQKALAALFRKNEINFSEQYQVDLVVNNIKITRGRVDFLIEDKMLLELKSGDYYRALNIKQLYTYLKSANLKLGILSNFTSRGLIFKRIVNLYP